MIKFTSDNDFSNKLMFLDLVHHGIKGQKWGVRRYQNKDGSLTNMGRSRYLNNKTGMSRFAGMDPFIRDSNMDSSRFREVVSIDSTNYYPENSKLLEERFREDYLLNPDDVFDKVVQCINPKEETGTTNNCTKCASAMIMAKKGYAFNAGRALTGNCDAFSYWFDGAEKKQLIIYGQW